MTPEIKNQIERLRRGEVSRGAWTKAKLSEISTIITGSTPPTVNTEAYSGDNFFITPSDFQGNKYITKTIRHLSDSCFETSRIIPANSIYVVCIGATVGKINMCQREATCNQQINAIVPNREVDTEFLYYEIDYMFNREKKRYIGEQTLPIVNKSTFSNLLLDIPSFSEQQIIAKILTTQDKVIELKEKLIAEKQRQKKYLMQQLLTGKKRLSGYTGKWKKVKAKTVFKNVVDKNHNGIPEVLSVTQDRGIIPRSRVEKDIKYDDTSLPNYKLVSPGNFVISLRSFQGGIEYSKFEGIVSPAYTVLSCKVPIDEGYYQYYFKSTYYINRLQIAVYGIRDGKQISYDDFGFIEIHYPPIEEQSAIAKILMVADQEINLLQQSLEQEKQKKKALMQLLLTGIVRVSA